MQTFLERLLLEAAIIGLQFAILRLVSWLRERSRTEETGVRRAATA